MKLRPDTGLSFDDVLLVPRRSTARSRKDVSTRTRLTAGIELAIPIISANMDTVTESRMAIAIAQQGGLGILHRFMSTRRQVEMVRRVKRAENMVVEDPVTIPAEATVDQARQRMAEAEVGGLMVTDSAGVLIGLVATRDVLLAPDGGAPVSSVMTPRARLVVADASESMEQARQALHAHRVEKLPLVDAAGRLVGLITTQDIVKIQEHPDATKDARGRLMVGVAIGVRPEDMERAAACVEADADVLVVDIAHGHSEHTLEMVRKLKRAFPDVPVIAGNVATADGVRDLAAAGADAVKGRGRFGLDLHHPDGNRVRRAAAHRDLGLRGSSPRVGRAGHRRRRHPHLRRSDQGRGSRGQHGDGRLDARRHGRKPGGAHRARRAALQGGARHGLADR